jgi:NADH:ubiquinone oxidoreductase subunit F (NADH-binding)
MSPRTDIALPRLLAGMPEHGALGLAAHRAIHGELPYGTRRERRGAADLIELVEQAGLLGRGGAAFPLARKLRAVAAGGGRTPLGKRPIVLANGSEGEPASAKDRLLLESLPHLVLDGGVLAARAVGADELIVCVDESAGRALRSVTLALAERERTGSDALRIGIQAVPEGYVSGQETALVNLCSGGPARPTLTPPMPFQRGVRRRPTLVNNAETLAQLALIARHGPRWFRALGTRADPGSALLTLSGAAAYPGVYEIELGAPLPALIEAAGGATSGLRAVLLGGYGGTWLDGAAIPGLALANDRLAADRASLGAGVVVLFSEQACPVAETARVTRWLAAQSAGQCGPCVHGLDAIAGAIEEVAHGAATPGVGERIARWCSLATGRGACRHPDGAVRFITSALGVFAEEFADHARHGRCDACTSAPELPLPNHYVELAAAA